VTELPDSRHSLRGLDSEGNEAWLIRGIAGKLYRCPGCHGEIEIGDEHVIVHYVRRAGGQITTTGTRAASASCCCRSCEACD
jgi:hypothetical protein